MLQETERTTTELEQQRAAVAHRIALEVRRPDQLGHSKLAKVSSLTHAFRLSSGATRFRDVRSSLAAEGIQLESGWFDAAGDTEIRRSGVVRLFPGDGPLPAADPDLETLIQMSVWSKDSPGVNRPFPPTGREPGEVLWFDIDPVVAVPSKEQVDPEGYGWRDRLVPPGRHIPDTIDRAVAMESMDAEVNRRASDLMAQLEPWCPGLDVEMVRDLIHEDPQPKVEAYGDELGPVRSVSVVAAIARELPGDEDDSDGVSEELLFQLVEITVGEGWILTCWHPSHSSSGATEEKPDTFLLQEPFLSNVRRHWSEPPAEGAEQHRAKTSSDLGLFLVKSLTHTYEASHRMMQRWMASWEVEFYTSLKSSDRAGRLKAAAKEISDFLSITADIRRRLTGFQHARLSTADKTWFPDVTGHSSSSAGASGKTSPVHSLVESLDVAKEGFDRLSQDIRANMDVLMLQSTATQQEASERVQSYLGKVTGLVLVPTFIAGLFGANTRVPGGGSWGGFELMLVLMLVSAVAVYLIMRGITKQARKS